MTLDQCWNHGKMEYVVHLTIYYNWGRTQQEMLCKCDNFSHFNYRHYSQPDFLGRLGHDITTGAGSVVPNCCRGFSFSGPKARACAKET